MNKERRKELNDLLSKIEDIVADLESVRDAEGSIRRHGRKSSGF